MLRTSRFPWISESGFLFWQVMIHHAGQLMYFISVKHLLMSSRQSMYGHASRRERLPLFKNSILAILCAKQDGMGGTRFRLIPLERRSTGE
jgi:hypothetical protein